jgi:hypothetical protein
MSMLDSATQDININIILPTQGISVSEGLDYLQSPVLHSTIEVLKNILRLIGRHRAVSTCAQEKRNPSISPSSVMVWLIPVNVRISSHKYTKNSPGQCSHGKTRTHLG